MKLTQAFEVVRGDVVAFIGAGGKTSLLVGLGYELAEAGWRVLATTTTTLAQEQLALFPHAMPFDAPPNVISRALSRHHFALLHAEVRNGRVRGPGLTWTAGLLDSVDSDILLVEADEAHGLPFKAPGAGEPQIPLETSLVVPVASLSALGKPLDAEHIYNPGAMIERFGFAEHSPIKSPWLAQVLRDESLGLRGAPSDARVTIFLNQTPERGYVRGRARMIARLCLQSERVSAVAMGTVRGAAPVSEVQRPVGALILASCAYAGRENGAAANPGARSQPARVAQQLQRSRIDHIRVVAGGGAGGIRRRVRHLGVKTAHNRRWQEGGLLSALEAGMESLPDQVAAFLLAPDDPAGLQPRVASRVLAAYARGEGEFIVPRFRGVCSSPALVGRRRLNEILRLPRDTGWRAIIQRFGDEIAFLDMHGECALPLPGLSPSHSLLSLAAPLPSRDR